MRNTLDKILLVLAGFVLAGCAGGQQYVVTNMDGSFYRVSEIGHNNIARKGAHYSLFELCTKAGLCQMVAEKTVINPSLIEQLAGPGATVVAADRLRSGLEDSGDTVSNTASGGEGGQGGTGGAGGAGGLGGSGGTSNGCKGNCGGFAKLEGDRPAPGYVNVSENAAREVEPDAGISASTPSYPPVFRHAVFTPPRDLGLTPHTGTLHHFRPVDALANTPALTEKKADAPPVKVKTVLKNAAAPLKPAADSIKVLPGDTLFKLAERVRPEHADPEVLAVALWKANKGKFIEGNMNGIRTGTVLSLKDLDQHLAALNPGDGRAMVRTQWALWKNRGEKVEPAVQETTVVAMVAPTKQPAPGVKPAAKPAQPLAAMVAVKTDAPSLDTFAYEIRATLKACIDRLVAWMG